MQLTTLNDLFVEQLADLHSAETQLIDALPKLASAASNDELKQAFQHHLEETRDHVRRLDDIIAGLGRAVPTEICEGMRGLIREGEEMVTAGGDPDELWECLYLHLPEVTAFLAHVQGLLPLALLEQLLSMFDAAFSVAPVVGLHGLDSTACVQRHRQNRRVI